MNGAVTGRIKEFKQPRGGYIGPRLFEQSKIQDGKLLCTNENQHGTIVGSAVDYLARVSLGMAPEKAFSVSLKGAANLGVRSLETVAEPSRAKKMASEVCGLDDRSIINACMLSGYDICYRRGTSYYVPVDSLVPDISTICNIRLMTERVLEVIRADGSITQIGSEIRSESAKYVQLGDIDYATENTLWDLKVSREKPTSKHTLQILVYYLMGIRDRALKESFSRLKYLGIINPRLCLVYKIAISEIPPETISAVEKDVIGY